MPGMAIEDNLDLVKASLSNEPRNKFEETMRLTDYPLVRLFFEEAKMVLGGGKTRKWKIRLRNSDTFAFVDLYEITPNNKINVMEEAEIPWRMTEFKQMYDTREEDFNGGAEKLVDYVDTMESSMWEDGIDGMDTYLARAPLNSTDRRSYHGLPYWFPKVATGSVNNDGGFVGTTVVFRNGTTSTTCAGIDANTAANQRWRPFAGTYARIDGAFLRLLRAALTRTDFKMLDQLKGKPIKGSGKKTLLCGHATADAIEELMNANDPSGNDPMKVTSASGTLRNIPITRVPQFDAEMEDSVIGINTRHVYGIEMRGRHLKRSTWKSTDNPNIVFDQIDSTSQLECNNRQKGGFHLHLAW